MKKNKLYTSLGGTFGVYREGHKARHLLNCKKEYWKSVAHHARLEWAMTIPLIFTLWPPLATEETQSLH
jgi:hypothetical protein